MCAEQYRKKTHDNNNDIKIKKCYIFLTREKADSRGFKFKSAVRSRLVTIYNIYSLKTRKTNKQNAIIIIIENAFFSL